MRKFVWMGIVLILLCVFPAAAVNYPKPTGWVSDYAGVLTKAQVDELGWLLKDFETATTHQIFVGIMSEIPADTTLDEYVNELFIRWKPGQQGKDNGALLAIFINSRQMRIETGYGLEDKLTDAQSKLILSNDIAPQFRQGDYYAGIQNGLVKMMRTIQPGYQPKISTPTTERRESSGGGTDVGTLLFVIVAMLIFFSMLSRPGGSKLLWFILQLLLSNSNVGWGYGRRGGWQSGSHHSSGRSSGSSSHRSSPGFSGGGGGRSGGGGASGRW